LISRRSQRRLTDVRDSIFHAWKVLLGLISAILGLIIASAIDRYFGSPVLEFLENFWGNNASGLLQSVTIWTLNNLITSAIVIFLLTSSVILVLAYLDTRPPKGLQPLQPFFSSQVEGGIVGAIINNNTGDDLINCRCHLHKVRIKKNRKWLSVSFPHSLPQELRWHLELGGSIKGERINIDSGNIGKSILAATRRFKVIEISDDYYILPESGEYEAEVVFGANRRDDSTITLRFWIEFMFDKETGNLSVIGVY
jgi:hypothetical protein